jgi:hypothetical protein
MSYVLDPIAEHLSISSAITRQCGSIQILSMMAVSCVCAATKACLLDRAISSSSVM